MAEWVNVRSIEALADLRTALGHFGNEVSEAIDAAETDIRRAQEWLRERELHWQREVERAREEVRRARAAFERCRSQVYRDRDGRVYHPPCTAEQAALARAMEHLRYTEAELQRVRMWQARVEQAVGEYRLSERRLRQLVTYDNERARAFLERIESDLQRYRAVALLAGVAVVLGGIAATVSAAVWGRAGLSAGSTGGPAAVGQIPPSTGVGVLAGLQAATWQSLGQSERGRVLQALENTMAQAQGRSPAPISVADLPPGEMGGYDPNSRTITVSRQHVMGRDVREVADTIVHEGRHAYQYYAIEHPGFHPDAGQVEAWRENLSNYLTADLYGYEVYHDQPVEADAFAYAEDVVNSLFE